MSATIPTTERFRFSPVGTVWPSGDFSVGYRKEDWAGPGSADMRSEAQRIDDGVYVERDSADYLRWQSERGDRPGRVLEALDSEAAWAAGPAGPLDLTDAPNSHKTSNRPETYGRLGQTGYGKKMVRSACTLLEQRYRGRLTFATVTMPTLPPGQRRQLALAWPEFVRQALQWLARRLEAKGLPKVVVSVSEIQPERLQAGNGGYLHLHMVWPNHYNAPGGYSVHPMAFRAWCEKFLIARGLFEDGSWVNVDVQPVRKSAAAYLSKYMSKGGDCLEAFAAENGWDAVPRQWWNLTKTIRDAVKRAVCQGRDVGFGLECMVRDCIEGHGGEQFWSVRHVDMELDGRLVTVGYTGILKQSIVKSYFGAIDTEPWN